MCFTSLLIVKGCLFGAVLEMINLEEVVS
jgi:hypothetical protein